MRSYSNFLLFEDVLANLPNDNSVLFSAAAALNTPSVRVIEEDCGTLLGTTLQLTPEVEGLVELATGENISRARIETLLGQGKYKVAVRSLHSCVSENGICRECYKGQYLYSTPPPVNALTKLQPLLNIQTDMITGNDTVSSYDLSLDEEEYNSVVIVKNGQQYTGAYTITGSTITFEDPITDSDIFVIRYMLLTTEPLQGYMARTYSGDLLGMKPLPTLPLLLRESLYSTIVPEGLVGSMTKALLKYRIIPSTFIDYIDRIPNRLEKALYILYLYAIYSNIQE